MHIYTSRKTGERLPSVTYIIEKTKPLSEIIKFSKAKEKKIEKDGWSNEDWNKHCSKARDRGSQCHAYLEWKLINLENKNKGKEEIFSFGEEDKYFSLSTIAGYKGSIDEWIKELEELEKGLGARIEVTGIEEEVTNEKLGYGGRSDLRIKVIEKTGKERNILIDLKTFAGYSNPRTGQMRYSWDLWRAPRKKVEKDPVTNKVRKEEGTKKPMKVLEEMPKINERGWEWVSHWCKNAFLQVALYVLAFREMGEKIDEAALLVVSPNQYQIIPMPRSIWKGCKEEALRRVEEFNVAYKDKWMLEMSYFLSGNGDEENDSSY